MNPFYAIIGHPCYPVVAKFNVEAHYMPHGIDSDMPSSDEESAEAFVKRIEDQKRPGLDWISGLTEEISQFYFALMTLTGGDHLLCSVLSERFLMVRMEQMQRRGQS